MSSVKVAVRVRPFNDREKGSKACVVMVSLIIGALKVFVSERTHHASCGPKYGGRAHIHF